METINAGTLRMFLDAEWYFWLDQAVKYEREENFVMTYYCEGHLSMIQKLRSRAGFEGDKRQTSEIVQEKLREKKF